MTNNLIPVALAQTDCVLGDKSHNLQHMADWCRQAAAKGAKLICFPELATTGYRGDLLTTRLWDLSEPLHGETGQLFSQLANTLSLTIVSGFIERGHYRGEIYNAVGVWTPEQTQASETFRKVHAFGTEKQWFASGDRYPVFDTPVGKIGVMICYDMGFPEVARILTLQGADILLAPSAWRVQDRKVWDINTACRALENGIHLLAVNRWGQEQDLQLFGGSKLLGPRGQILAEAGCDGEQLLFADIDLQHQAHTRLQVPYLRDRRYDTYNSLTQGMIPR